MAVKSKIFQRRVREEQCGELKEKTVAIHRVSKVVKGGRRFSFNAAVVCGDGQGHVGFGTGKAQEMPEAIRKAGEQARKSLVKLPLVGSTIPHDIIGHFGPSKVLLKPGQPGTGVIAGATVRAIVEAAGIKDIRTKCIGSTTANNVVYATLDGLLQMKDPEQFARDRGKTLEELGYKPY